MRNLLLAFFVVIANLSSAQTFSYRFKGTVNDEQKQRIETQLSAFPEFSGIKFRLKEQSGELIFIFKAQPARKEDVSTSPAIIAKSILIENGLEPIELVQLPN